MAAAKADDKFQFERHGYFVVDRVDHAAGKPVFTVFNLAAGLKDSWGNATSRLTFTRIFGIFRIVLSTSRFFQHNVLCQSSRIIGKR